MLIQIYRYKSILNQFSQNQTLYKLGLDSVCFWTMISMAVFWWQTLAWFQFWSNILHFEIHIMTLPFFKDAGCTCNGYIFLYQGNREFLYVYIGIACAFAIYLLYKTLRLCNIAFSYSNYHVHETYKLYALAFINLAFIILSRKSQLDYQNLYYSSFDQDKPVYDLGIVARGFEIVNDLFGVFSIFTNNFMHIYNSFTWLNIAFSCDYNFNKDSRIGEANNQLAELAELTENQEIFYQKKKERIRKIIKYVKYLVNYCLTLVMLIITVLGTLFYNQKINQSQQNQNQNDPNKCPVQYNEKWCLLATIMTIIATSLPLFLFGTAFFFYAKRLWDPQISKITKIGLVYLILTMLVRLIYFVIAKLNEFNVDPQKGQPSGDFLALIYTVFFTLVPIVVMSVLGQKQLQKQQYTLLRRSSLIFKSTVM